MKARCNYDSTEWKDYRTVMLWHKREQRNSPIHRQTYLNHLAQVMTNLKPQPLAASDAFLVDTEGNKIEVKGLHQSTYTSLSVYELKPAMASITAQQAAAGRLPVVGDMITHVHTGNTYTIIGQDSVIHSGVREIRYKLDDNSFLGATAFLKGYRLAVADDFKQAATPEVERRAAATAEDDGYIITGSDTFCSAASGVGEKLLKELEAKSRVNPTHNPDAPQTQEEIDAAWQRHKDFFGR